MDSLLLHRTIGHFKIALEQLLRGMNGLNKTYEQAMKRIDAQGDIDQGIALRVLSWLTYAKGALSLPWSCKMLLQPWTFSIRTRKQKTWMPISLGYWDD
jgi:hypothetical protein